MGGWDGTKQKNEQWKQRICHTLWLSSKDHSLDGTGIKEGGSHDLHHPDVIHIKVLGV